VHPLEEASAYKAMIEADGAHYNVARIASKIGRNQVYVATRLRLTELIPSIADAFLADQIGIGHALEIAKLPPSEQQRAFDAAFRTVWSGSKESRVLLPVRELTAWIEQNILLSLEAVPFDKNDETLVPEAGSCTNCPKRTGYNTLLFDAALKDSARTVTATTRSWQSISSGRSQTNPSWFRLQRHGAHAATAPCWAATVMSR
jgi:ParB family transcriptional regulator, chromosome partitioning protein